MNEKITIQKLGHSIAEEAQLLAEERWILEALNKIKAQRNSLQIERLQLESMKNELRNTNKDRSAADHHIPTPVEEPGTCSLHVMQNVSLPEPLDTDSVKDHWLEAEALCNKEQLNLNATNSVFSHLPIGDLNMEEEDEEFDDDEDEENLPIDMNMFMHGKQISKSIME